MQQLQTDTHTVDDQDCRRPSAHHSMWWATLNALDSRWPSRWLEWAASTDGIASNVSWQRRFPLLEEWSADELVRPDSGPRCDAMQAALVELTQSGSAEAGLTLLVQLRPGLVRLAQSASHWEWIMSHDVREETQATFFEVLFGHDLNRRPRRIAANLLLDTRQRLWRRHPRSGPPTMPTSLSSEIAGSTSASNWVTELEIWLHLQDGVNELPGSEDSRQLTATMAYLAWFEGKPVAMVASELGVTPQTVATRLYRLRRILRSSW